MTDDALHPDDELASAYLDDELDAAARAQVEASPQLMAGVEQLRQVRTAVADVPPPGAGERDVALAAALSIFDDLAAEPADTAAAVAAPAVVAPNVVPFRRRRTYTILSAAAAILLVGVVGVSVVGRGSDDDSSSGAADPPSEMVAADAATQTAGSDIAPDQDASTAGGAAPSTIAGISGPASAAPQVDDTEELLDIADELAPMSATADTAAPAETTAEKASTTAAPSPGARNSDAAFGCPLGPDQVFVTTVIWVDTTAAVLRNTVTGEVTAIDQQCNVLASVTP